MRQDNLLLGEVKRISKLSRKPMFGFRAYFATPTRKFEVLNVVGLRRDSDYVRGFTPSIELQVAVYAIDYKRTIYPNRKNINLILSMEQIDPISDLFLESGLKIRSSYKAFVIDNNDMSLEPGKGGMSKIQSDGRDELRILTVQLVDIGAVYASAKRGGVTFRYTTAFNAMSTFILAATKEPNQEDAKQIVGLDLVPPDVTKPRDTIIMNHKTALIDVPAWMQNNAGGIYNHGIGSFIQNSVWFVYPLFNTKRYGDAERRLTIFQIPSNYIPFGDSTWEKIGKSVKIVCSGAANLNDTSVGAEISEGTGVRFIHARKFIDGASTVEDNQGYFNRASNLAEINLVPREDGITQAPFSSVKATDNVARELSKISIRQGQVFDTLWMNANPNLINPGMPVKLYYDNGGKVCTLEGVVLSMSEKWNNPQPGLISKKLNCTVELKLFVAKPTI